MFGRLTFAALAVFTLCMASASRAQQATVPAGGQSCINWTYAENRSGVSSRPQVTFKNGCNRPVTAYVCTVTQYQSGGTAPCDPRFGGYWSRTFAALATTVQSASGGGTQIVVIKECPTGYNRIPNGNVSNFPCAR